MSNQLNVKLTRVDGADTLDIEDHGGENNIYQSPNPQQIAWHLDGNLNQAKFCLQSEQPPGFAWIEAPLPGIFSKPTINPNGRWVTLDDTHSSDASAGRWIYQIAVRLNGKVYVSENRSIDKTIKDPVIINK